MDNGVKGAIEKGFLTNLDSRSKLLNIILQSTMDAFWIMNIDGEILESNKVSVEMFGYSLDELMEMNISDLDIIKSKAELKEQLEAIKKTGRDRFETKCRLKDGSIKEFEISITFVDCLKEPIFNVFARDITERKEKQRELESAYRGNQEVLDELRKHHSRTNVILQTSMDAFWIMNIKGDILDTNEAFVDLFGYTLLEIVDMDLNIRDLDFSKTQEEVKEQLDYIKLRGRDRFETKYRLKNGELRDLEVSITFIDCIDGSICLEEPIFNVFARDITERKRKQRELEKAYRDNKEFIDELRKQNNRINTILQTSMDAFWVMNTEGDILETNEAYMNLFGYSLLETVNMNISDLDISRDKKELKEQLEEIKKKGKDRFESKYRLKNGEVRDLEISVTFVDSLDEPIFEVFGRDITERKLRDEELRRAQKHLMQSEKMAALGRLVAGVAHEINTPVGIGVTAVSHLAEKIKKFAKLYKEGNMKRSDLERFLKLAWESAEMTLKNLNNASELINNFKLVAADQTNNKKRRFNVKEYLDDIIISLKPKLSKTKHKVIIDCNEELEIDNYPGAISRIITNLVMNSLIHGFEEKDKGEIKIEVLEENELIELRYSDNGVGFPKENINKIFEPFFTTKRGQGGTGLGLNLIYNIVNNILKGDIECKSTIGEGITFIIKFPKEVD
ncbi:PAS domain S-box-containing protein [Orenia metallireducens]|uniref:histidine kinase n=1 Tax=Orenia metallireducens TaxID=1413210 RepID=A0A285GSB1_9FIRM|nr:PAS domain-containing sensor histidine kinase [Orenia metallireducens]SNY26442.1 PAS domain S-box-containing protein [Orenia metallireducens]